MAHDAIEVDVDVSLSDDAKALLDSVGEEPMPAEKLVAVLEGIRVVTSADVCSSGDSISVEVDDFTAVLLPTIMDAGWLPRDVDAFSDGTAKVYARHPRWDEATMERSLLRD